MNTTQKRRLLKLYRYTLLPQKAWAHKKFSFGMWNNKRGGFDLTASQNVCGTLGCLAGELPNIFPTIWSWNFNGIVLSKGHINPRIDLCDFFGLSLGEVDHIFIPLEQRSYIDPYYSTHPPLGATATRREVIKNFHRFMKIKGLI